MSKGNHDGVADAVKAITGTSRGYNGDWHALFTARSIPSGTYNERMLKFLNQVMATNYASLPQAQHVYAVRLGFNNWSSMTTMSLTP